ncbi:soluble scavenger receptor cysteine-rich domain-containing protein SSC5D-like [Macrobrachium nipponense]|uniref:soluble scavenger receptor cysteine-rich domain-containing protein SSC5D-like n=1 Tax=Macrobrachium nipponense TaxID=159736 RepID=UPI0030C7E7C8
MPDPSRIPAPITLQLMLQGDPNTTHQCPGPKAEPSTHPQLIELPGGQDTPDAPDPSRNQDPSTTNILQGTDTPPCPEPHRSQHPSTTNRLQGNKGTPNHALPQAEASTPPQLNRLPGQNPMPLNPSETSTHQQLIYSRGQTPTMPPDPSRKPAPSTTNASGEEDPTHHPDPIRSQPTHPQLLDSWGQGTTTMPGPQPRTSTHPQLIEVRGQTPTCPGPQQEASTHPN